MDGDKVPLARRLVGGCNHPPGGLPGCETEATWHSP